MDKEKAEGQQRMVRALETREEWDWTKQTAGSVVTFSHSYKHAWTEIALTNCSDSLKQ